MTAGMTWQAALVWRVGPARMQRGTQGHVAELRVAHAGSLGGPADVDAWQGPCESTQMPGRGATWQSGGWYLKGPRVSGPWLGVWGGNANALCRPLLYTQLFRPLSPCGTMFPRIFLLQATWTHGGRRMRL